MNISGKHVREMYTPLNPTFIWEKTGACRGIPNFLIFDSKHTLRVLVRTDIVGTRYKFKKLIAGMIFLFISEKSLRVTDVYDIT